jgi:hypothetical protein
VPEDETEAERRLRILGGPRETRRERLRRLRAEKDPLGWGQRRLEDEEEEECDEEEDEWGCECPYYELDNPACEEMEMSATDQFLLSMGMTAEELIVGNILMLVLATGGFVGLHLLFIKKLTAYLAVKTQDPHFALPTPLLFPCPEVLLFFM